MAQREVRNIVQNNKSAAGNFKSCYLQVYNSQSFDLLRSHIPIGEPTLEQLNDPNFATPAEIKAILAEHPKTQACRQQFVAALSRATPTFAAIWADLFIRSDNNLLDLINRKETWGEATKRSRRLVADTSQRLLAEAERVRAGLNQENQAELMRRQAAFDALARWAQTQEMINAMNRPVVTNYSQFGSMVSCMSR